MNPLPVLPPPSCDFSTWSQCPVPADYPRMWATVDSGIGHGQIRGEIFAFDLDVNAEPAAWILFPDGRKWMVALKDIRVLEVGDLKTGAPR